MGPAQPAWAFSGVAYRVAVGHGQTIEVSAKRRGAEEQMRRRHGLHATGRTWHRRMNR